MVGELVRCPLAPADRVTLECAASTKGDYAVCHVCSLCTQKETRTANLLYLIAHAFRGT